MALRCSSPSLPPVDWDEPTLLPATKPRDGITIDVMTDDGNITNQSAFLVSGRFAYRRIPNKQDIALGGKGLLKRGRVVFCVALERSIQAQYEANWPFPIYKEPASEQEAIRVAVKEVRKRQYALRRHSHREKVRVVEVDVRATNENPYHEVAALHHLRKDDGVLTCFEALETDSHVYVITPYMAGGELHAYIPWRQQEGENNLSMGLPTAKVRILFKRIAATVSRMHAAGVCHLDLKNENIVLEDQVQVDDIDSARPLIIDFAMSLRVPTSRRGNHKITANGGGCGTIQYMAPEVLAGATSIDGFQVDVWCLGITLFRLLLARPLYEMPHHTDMFFKHFIRNDGLTNDDFNNRFRDRGLDILKHLEQHQNAGLDITRVLRLLCVIRVVQQLEAPVRDLLQKMLREDPNQRITMADVLQHPWLA